MAGSIQIENLKAKRGTFELTVSSLSIAPREVFAILGETGAGKTILLEAIAGAFSLEEGFILLDGKDVETLPIQQRHLGILYQDHALFPHMTVRENIAYGLRCNGSSKQEIRAKVDESLEMFSIKHIEHSYPGVISGGESQRTAFARALVLRPDILLLDEPFSSLDPPTKERMYTLIRKVHAQFDCTIVFVTHDFNEAVVLADRVGIVLGGSLCAVQPACELFDGEYASGVRQFLGIEER